VPAYLDALAREAGAASGAHHTADTIYIGGGTPTVLAPAQIKRLFDRLAECFDIRSDAEITVEANPCSLDPETVETLAVCGVNRISLGAQSFADAELRFLGRSHCARDIRRGFSLLRAAGLDNISLDLIYAIPNQSHESWMRSLSHAIELGPQHISTYCLTYEDSTPLWRSLQRGEIAKKSGDEELELYEIARETLTHNGYEHYEISNFALPGRRSRHNMVYWANDEYVGLGAGAVSYLDGTRITNAREPNDYIHAIEAGSSAACDIERIPPRMQAVETLIQRLRLREGVDRAAFLSRFGLDPKEIFKDSFGELVAMGLLEQTADTVRSPLKGWRLANEVAMKALP
jgi:oxygen-independent coproporphyrinogen-3 oxidase